MTLATGKGGKYRYYKCSSRIWKGKDTCTTENLPTDQVDRLVFSSLADRVFTASRVTSMLEGIRKRLHRSRDSHDGKVKQLTKELEDVQKRSGQLYEAVEKGLLPMDASLTERANKLQAQRQTLLTELASVRRLKQMPMEAFGPKNVVAFTKTLRERLLGQDRTFGKRYLKLLVEEIRYQDKRLVMKGSYAAVGSRRWRGSTRHPKQESALFWYGLAPRSVPSTNTLF